MSLQEFLKDLKTDHKLFYYVCSESKYILKTITIKYFSEPMDSIFHNDSLILYTISKDHSFIHNSFLKCEKDMETTLFQIFKLQRKQFAFTWYHKQFKSHYSSPQWYISNTAAFQRHINNHLLGKVLLNTSFFCSKIQSGFDE